MHEEDAKEQASQKKTYRKPTLEKRERLVEVTEGGPINVGATP